MLIKVNLKNKLATYTCDVYQVWTRLAQSSNHGTASVMQLVVAHQNAAGV